MRKSYIQQIPSPAPHKKRNLNQFSIHNDLNSTIPITQTKMWVYIHQLILQRRDDIKYFYFLNYNWFSDNTIWNASWVNRSTHIDGQSGEHEVTSSGNRVNISPQHGWIWGHIHWWDKMRPYARVTGPISAHIQGVTGIICGQIQGQ